MARRFWPCFLRWDGVASVVVSEDRAPIVATKVEALAGSYPTPIEPLPSLSTKTSALWIKRDDKTHPLYGGNKVRKLELLIPDAIARGKRRIVTIGAAGSHHVLATTIFGVRAGLGVEAMLVPQRSTPHVEESLRADLGQGLVAHPARTFLGAGVGLLTRSLGDGYMVPMGGSNVVGSMGYVQAARELARQVREGVMPEPDWIIVTVGSGGTAAGLAAGLAAEGLRSRVLGVIVATPPFAVRWLTSHLMRRCYAKAGGRDPHSLHDRVTFTTAYLGAGYGEPTEKGNRAIAIASELGLHLDPTYTAKTFAAALDHVGSDGGATVLYWHTLSSAPMEPLVSKLELPVRLRALLK